MSNPPNKSNGCSTPTSATNPPVVGVQSPTRKPCCGTMSKTAIPPCARSSKRSANAPAFKIWQNSFATPTDASGLLWTLSARTQVDLLHGKPWLCDRLARTMVHGKTLAQISKMSPKRFATVLYQILTNTTSGSSTYEVPTHGQLQLTWQHWATRPCLRICLRVSNLPRS